MLETVQSVNAHTTIERTGHDNRGCLRELDDSLRHIIPIALSVSVEVLLAGSQVVYFEIPDLDTTIVGD